MFSFSRASALLANYPCEFLYSPVTKAFLTETDMDVILTRFAWKPESLIPDKKSVRILVAFAAPAEEGELDPGELIEKINGSDQPGKIEADVKRDAFYEQLLKQMNDQSITHFISWAVVAPGIALKCNRVPVPTLFAPTLLPSTVKELMADIMKTTQQIT